MPSQTLNVRKLIQKIQINWIKDVRPLGLSLKKEELIREKKWCANKLFKYATRWDFASDGVRWKNTLKNPKKQLAGYREMCQFSFEISNEYVPIANSILTIRTTRKIHRRIAHKCLLMWHNNCHVLRVFFFLSNSQLATQTQQSAASHLTLAGRCKIWMY